MPKQKNNQSNNKEILRRLFRPAGNIAFLDAEFNCGMNFSTGESINEVISIGLVICNANYEELHRFYTLVNPQSGNPVFPMITKMTGITSTMLKGQPRFAAVSDKITALMRKYEVWDVFAWGNADQHALMKERNLLKARRYASAEALAKWNYIDLCTDISSAVSNLMLGIRGGLAINMENLMFVCGITEKQEHNALTDALYLSECMGYLQKYYPIEHASGEFMKKRELVNAYYQERSTYNSFRRFRASSRGSDLYGRYDEGDFVADMRLKALEDDIRFLKGEIPFDLEFDSIQDYFEKRNGS